MHTLLSSAAARAAAAALHGAERAEKCAEIHLLAATAATGLRHHTGRRRREQDRQDGTGNQCCDQRRGARHE